MSLKKILLTLTLAASFGLVACGDDSSSGSNSKGEFVTNPTDPVKCEFKEACTRKCMSVGSQQIWKTLILDMQQFSSWFHTPGKSNNET